MKTIAAMLTLGVACWAFGTQAQTFDTRLLSQYDASVLRELYPVCRHTTVSAEQQVRLAERIRQMLSTGELRMLREDRERFYRSVVERT